MQQKSRDIRILFYDQKMILLFIIHMRNTIRNLDENKENKAMF